MARLSRFLACSEVTLVESDDDQDGKGGQLDQEHVRRMKGPWGQEATGRLQYDEGKQIEGWLITEERIGLDTNI